MATLAVTDVTRVPGGTVIPFVAATAGGDRMPVTNHTYLLVRNSSAAPINVTIDTTGVAFNAAPVPDTVVAVAAGVTTAIPISLEYRSNSDGMAGIAYSAVTTVTVAAITID